MHGDTAVHVIRCTVLGRSGVFVAGPVVAILIEAEQRLGFGRVGTTPPATVRGLRFHGQIFGLGLGFGHGIERGFLLDGTCAAPSMIAAAGF